MSVFVHYIEEEHEGLGYDCDQCNYRTKHRASRDMHIKSVHKGRKCNLCDFQTSSESYVRTHRKAEQKGIVF